MKKKSLLVALTALVLGGGSLFAQTESETTTQTLTPDIDTYLRYNNTTNHGSETTMEIYTYATNNLDFVGVMKFTLPTLTAKQEIKSAKLRLTTERIKGDGQLNIYPFTGTITSSSKYADSWSSIDDEVNKRGTAIATVSLKGLWNKAIDLDKLTDDTFASVDQWQNTIDITDYVQSLTSTNLSILLTKNVDQNAASKIFTSEATDITVKKSDGTTVTFAAADLQPQLVVEIGEATDTYSSTLTPTADTNVGSSLTKSVGSSDKMEIYTGTRTEKDGTTTDLDYAGLMQFELPSQVLDKNNYEVKSATLRLVTERAKGGKINIFAIDKDVTEDALYTDWSDAITTARNTTALATFDPNQSAAKSVVYDEITDDNYKNIAAWTNYIDLTSYVQSATSAKVNLLLSAAETNTNQKCFFSKESTGFTYDATDNKPSFSATADEVVPQLVIVYKKKAGYDIEIGTAGYATAYYGDEALTVPTGVTASTYAVVNNVLTATKTYAAGEVIPKATGVVLKGDAATYRFAVSSEAGEAPESNQLYGSDEDATTNVDGATKYYMLSLDSKNENPGFYWGADNGAAFTNAAHKAYLALGTTASVKAFLFDGSTVTGISTISTKTNDVNAPVYTLSGVRMSSSKLPAGVYIKSGKKFIVK